MIAQVCECECVCVCVCGGGGREGGRNADCYLGNMG